MKIKSFLPQREIEICLRVREVRLAHKWSQPDFSKALGIGRERLASYEYAKAPVRVQTAAKLLEKFKVDAKWLATGEGEAYCPFTLQVHPSAFATLSPRTLFSDAYDKHLIREIESRAKLRMKAKQQGMEIQFPVPIGTPRRDQFLWEIGETIKQDIQSVPEDLLGNYAQSLYTTSQEFIVKQQSAGKSKRRQKGT